jgi:hypothetical protein
VKDKKQNTPNSIGATDSNTIVAVKKKKSVMNWVYTPTSVCVGGCGRQKAMREGEGHEMITQRVFFRHASTHPHSSARYRQMIAVLEKAASVAFPSVAAAACTK